MQNHKTAAYIIMQLYSNCTMCVCVSLVCIAIHNVHNISLWGGGAYHPTMTKAVPQCATLALLITTNPQDTVTSTLW